jgi:hypothetical protein
MDERRRAVLAELRSHLWTIGSANDAQDHGSGEEAVRMREESCEAIERLLLEHPFVGEFFPGLRRALHSGHILGSGWAQLSDSLDARVQEADAGPGKR